MYVADLRRRSGLGSGSHRGPLTVVTDSSTPASVTTFRATLSTASIASATFTEFGVIQRVHVDVHDRPVHPDVPGRPGDPGHVHRRLRDVRGEFRAPPGTGEQGLQPADQEELDVGVRGDSGRHGLPPPVHLSFSMVTGRWHRLPAILR